MAQNCGKHVWEDTTTEEATVIQDLLKKRVEIPSCSTYCQRGATNRSFGSSVSKSIRQFIGGSQTDETLPTVRSDRSQSSTAIPMGDLNNHQSSSNTRADSPPVGQAKRSLWVLLGTPKSQPLMEAAEIKIDEEDSQCDWNFYRSLRNCYRAKRGALRLWFSCWQLSHCDFVKVSQQAPPKQHLY